MKQSLALIGNNLAILVAATEIVEKGIPVTLFTDGKPLGGHFTGIDINGDSFDIGMVFIEKIESTSNNADIQTYSPLIRNDWTRFGSLASEWIEKKTKLVKIPTPGTLIHKKIVPDYLIANRLDAFKGQSIKLLSKSLNKTNALHAFNKVTSPEYETLDYLNAAKFNHGEDLHSAFIDPYIHKFTASSSTKFLARYHRAAWVPLYFPETLLKACSDGRDVNLPEYSFWTTPGGCTGKLIRDIASDLSNNPLVSVNHSPIVKIEQIKDAWTIDTNDSILNAKQIALGLTGNRACELLGLNFEEPKNFIPVDILFAMVKTSSLNQSLPPCIMIVDEDYASYRLVNQDALAGIRPLWSRITIEANPNTVLKTYPDIDIKKSLELEIRRLLSNSNLMLENKNIKSLKHVQIKNALQLPTYENVEKNKKLNDDIQKTFANCYLTGNLLGYGVSSLNDQIIQGLQISARYT